MIEIGKYVYYSSGKRYTLRGVMELEKPDAMIILNDRFDKQIDFALSKGGRDLLISKYGQHMVSSYKESICAVIITLATELS